MAFHHTKVVQRKPPKPHLRLRYRRLPAAGTWHGGQWAVERLTHRPLALDFGDGPPPIPAPQVSERTQWWGTSRLALDAAFYQFTCEWPAGRPC